MNPKMLSDLKVVELGEFITAPFCAKMLADWGAEVIKIEIPDGGDKSRRHGPFPGGKKDPEKSGLYLYLNCNKKGVTLDVTQSKGREILKELLKDADIFVQNNPPKMMRELGLDYASLKKDFPKLIMTSIAPFGQKGPYCDWKGNSINLAAISGIAIKTGSPNREPLDHPMSSCDFQGAIVGGVACMTALFARDNTGKGRHCDIDISHALISYQGVGHIKMYKKFYETTMRTGMHSNHGIYPWGVHPCKDGFFCMNTLIYEHWERFIKELGSPEWSKDPKFNPPDRTVFSLSAHWEELDEALEKELKKYTKQELLEAAKRAEAAFYPVTTLKEMIESPQVEYRNEIVEMDHPKAGKLKYPGAPAILSKTPWSLEHPAPLLGQHNKEIFGLKLEYTEDELSQLKKEGVI